jgi:hypothetical protein
MCALAHFSSLASPLSTGGFWLCEEMYVCIGALLLLCFTIEYWGLLALGEDMCALAHFSFLASPGRSYVCIGALLLP